MVSLCGLSGWRPRPAASRGEAVWSGLLSVLLSIGTTVVVLAAVRMVFMAMYLDRSTLVANGGSVPLMLWNAFRFDLQVGCYVAIPLVVMWVVTCVAGKGLGALMLNFSRQYIPIMNVLVALLGAADIHYYSNFARHFDIVVFDFFDEEPATLIKGIWEEAPVLVMTLAAVGVYLLCRWTTGRLLKRVSESRGRSLVVAVPVFLVLLAFGFRGSFSTFTLRAEDIYVSSSQRVNDCVPNALFMLKKAWSEKKHSFSVRPDEEVVKGAGFESVEEMIAAALSIDVDSARQIDVEEALFRRTGEEPICEGYNVVFVVAESWGAKMLDYERRYGLDLLSSMRRHMEEDTWFRHFVSHGMGTIEAVEHLTTYSAFERLFTSRYREVEFPTAPARSFRDAGYDTWFVSGIQIAWRNCQEVLPHQGFDHVLGKYEILAEEPEAEVNETWGVYDHSMLDYVLRTLEDTTSGKPKYIVALTSTSHTPFEFPEGYELPGLKVPEDRGAFDTSDTTVIWQYMRGFQYESRAMGDFMTKLKASAAGRRTVVAITGDHRIRMILPYTEAEDPVFRAGVPLYLYVPGGVEADTSRYGCHSDIAPTLAELTLRGARYYGLGSDLLGRASAEGSYGTNVEVLVTAPDADRVACERKAAARSALNEIVFGRAISGR